MYAYVDRSCRGTSALCVSHNMHHDPARIPLIVGIQRQVQHDGQPEILSTACTRQSDLSYAYIFMSELLRCQCSLRHSMRNDPARIPLIIGIQRQAQHDSQPEILRTVYT